MIKHTKRKYSKLRFQIDDTNDINIELINKLGITRNRIDMGEKLDF